MKRHVDGLEKATWPPSPLRERCRVCWALKRGRLRLQGKQISLILNTTES